MVQPAADPTRIVLCVAHKIDPGLDPDKQVNEDSCGYQELALGHVLVVADGMGGHLSGKEASERTVQVLLHDLENALPGTQPGLALKQAIEHAGSVVYEIGGQGPNPLRPGSTCVALTIHRGGTEVAHVGDSRAYMIRGGGIYPLTRDHSMVQQMIDAGLLTPEDAIGHPDANKITRALGMTPTVEVELRANPVAHAPGDLFLLATDGLSDLVMAEETLNIVTQARQARGLEFACDQLVALANTRGGHDNITVLLAEIVSAPSVPKVQHTVLTGDEAVAPMLAHAKKPNGVHPTMVDDPGAGGAAAAGFPEPTMLQSPDPAAMQPAAAHVGMAEPTVMQPPDPHAVQPGGPPEPGPPPMPATLPPGPNPSAVAVVQDPSLVDPQEPPTLQRPAAALPGPEPATLQPVASIAAEVSASGVSRTWVGEDGGQEDDTVRVRRVLWIGVGLGLVLLAVAIIVLSVWWALSSPTTAAPSPFEPLGPAPSAAEHRRAEARTSIPPWTRFDASKKWFNL